VVVCIIASSGHRSYSISMSSPQKRMLARKGSSDHPEVGFNQKAVKAAAFLPLIFLGETTPITLTSTKLEGFGIISIRCL